MGTHAVLPRLNPLIDAFTAVNHLLTEVRESNVYVMCKENIREPVVVSTKVDYYILVVLYSQFLLLVFTQL